MNNPPDAPTEQAKTPLRDWLVAIFLAEATALMIALVSPITPSKTGSTWSPAEFFWAEPSYLQDVVVSFGVVNAMFIVIGILAWISLKVRPPSGS